MKLDATQLRYMSKEEFRLLQSVEMGSRNHEIVPISLICRMTKLRPQTATRQLQALAKNKLVSFEADSKCKTISIVDNNNNVLIIYVSLYILCISLDEGVRLTYGGYDFLALKAFSSRETVLSIGQQIGVGKESDIYLVHGTHHFETIENEELEGCDSEDEELAEEIESCVQVSGKEYQERVLKIQRLGRTSFRTVKTNRDYHQHRSSCSWLYLSRLAAGLEYRFMKALRRVGLPVPKPLDWSRHCVVMELIKGTLFENVRLRDRHMSDFKSAEYDESDTDQSETETEFVENRVVEYVEEEDLPGLYVRLMELIAELASYGLIHGDFNEFNLLITRNSNSNADPSIPRVSPVIIDFPQMVSIDHENAESYFNRDVECIRTFFAKRFNFSNDDGELFEAKWENVKRNEEHKLDVELKASGYIKPKREKKREHINKHSDKSESDVSEYETSEDSDSDSDS